MPPPRRRALVRLVWRRATLLALVVPPVTAWAQDPTASVHGTVVGADAREPLPFVTVTLDSAGATVFSDSSGRFRLGPVAVGRHQLRVRELGFVALDTTFELVGGESLEVSIALARIPLILPPVLASARLRCVRPGVTDSSMAPALVTLAAQLVANAERARLFARQSGYEYWVEARISRHVEYRPELDQEEIDTIAYTGTGRHVYRPGDMIDDRLEGRRVSSRGYEGTYIHLPDLEDLAEPSFLSHHCFSFGGLDTAAGQPELRVDFRPLDRMHAADAEGSFFLDPQRFTARRAVMWLTRGEDQVPYIRRLEGHIWYREIAPYVAVEDSARYDLNAGAAITGGEIASVELQHVVELRMRRQKPRRSTSPSGATRPPVPDRSADPHI